MFSHIVLGANDTDASKKFYDATLSCLGYETGTQLESGRTLYNYGKGVFFAFTKPLDGSPASSGNGSTVSFSAPSAEAINAWHAAGLETGGSECEDPPGVRDFGGAKLYLAYLRDPSGNKIAALCNLSE
ncbi:MAG: glyoxalase [Gammaproteobacteria bacterium]|nr:glyoxalase [Gammaproteobacteria bacterium]